MKPDEAYISFGKGNRLLSEDHYLKFLKPLGLSRHGFRKWCASLNVPMIEFPGNRRFVDLYTFKVALRAISRVGQPNFRVPGCTTRPDPRSVSTLDQAYFRDNWKSIVSELVAARLDPLDTANADVKAAAEAAADRLALCALYAIREQKSASTIATRQATNLGVFRDP